MQLELEHPTDPHKVVKAKADAQGALVVTLTGDAPDTTPVLPEGAATEAHQAAAIIVLSNLLTELQAKANVNETQPVSVVPGAATTTATVAASLNAGTNVIPAGLLSVVIINDSTSAGAMTVATANGSASLNPGESVTFEAENPNSLLDGITVTGGFAITGRLFATKRATL